MTKRKHSVPCLCGHARVNHVYHLWEHETLSCGVWACECDDYKADNLRYLEEKYDKRNS